MPERARLVHLLTLAVALAVLAFVVVTADPREVWQALRRVDRGPAQAAVLLNLPVAALYTVRSLLVLRHMDHKVPFGVLAPATVLGNVVGALTPAASGDLLRVTSLQRNSSLTMTDAFALVVYERLVSGYLLLVSTGVALSLTTLPLALGAVAALLGLLMALLPWLTARFILPQLPAPTIVTGDSVVSRAIRHLLTMASQVWLMLKDLRLLTAWSALTVGIFALVALQYHLSARAGLMHLGILDAWVAFGGGAMAAIASLLPLGLGIGDGSTAAIIHATGIPLESATAITILIRGTVTLPLIALALLSYLYLSRRRPAVEDGVTSVGPAGD